MSDEIELFDAGRAALVAGDVRPEAPPAENGPRWGAAAVLRPAGPVLGSLAELVDSMAVAAGDGHWAHHRSSLHFTLRALEHYRSTIPVGDARRIAYAEALEAAAEGMPPALVELRGVCPHPAGVVAVGYPLDGVLATLQVRFAEELRAREVAGFEAWVRDRWYVSLFHFAGPVANRRQVAAWCDERRDVRIGVVALDTVEVVRWHFMGAGVRAEGMHKTRLVGESAVECRRTDRVPRLA